MSQVTWHRVTDTKLYYEKSVPFFIKDEAMYNLPLGIAGRLKANPKTFGDTFNLFILTEGHDIEIEANRSHMVDTSIPYRYVPSLQMKQSNLFFRTQEMNERPTGLVGTT